MVKDSIDDRQALQPELQLLMWREGRRRKQMQLKLLALIIWYEKITPLKSRKPRAYCPPPPLLAPPAPVLSDYQLPTYKTAPGDSQTQATPSSKKVRGINVSWAFWLGQLMLRFLHKDFSLLSYVRAEDVLLQ